MKYLFIIILLATFTMASAQDDSTKMGTVASGLTKEVEYGGEGTLDDFVTSKINSDVRKYINRNCLNNKFYAVMRIDQKGNVSDVQISEGDDMLVNNEIIRVLKQTKWKPATINGAPISRKIVVPVTFLY